MTEMRSTQRYFETHADRFDRLYTSPDVATRLLRQGPRRSREFAISVVASRPSPSVLDVGCGPGRALDALGRRGVAALGIAGSGLIMATYVSPRVGFLYGLIAFTAVALGGFGSLGGTLLAAVIIGEVEVFSGLYIGPEYKYVSVFVLYLLVLLWRPKQGLLGW